MITAHMDTMNAAALLTDSVIIMLTITETVQCLLLLAQEVALLGEALRHRTHILTLEFEIPSPSLILHGVTCTEMTEEDVLIERTITVGADHLIPRSPDTHPRSGPQDRTLKPLIPPREPLYLREEAHDLNPGVDLPVLIRSAAPAAQAAAGVIFFQVLVFMFMFQDQKTFDCHYFCITKYCTLTFGFLYFFFNLLFFFSNLLLFDNSDSNSTSSDGSRARSVQSSATHAQTQSSMVIDSDEPRRSFGIKVQNLPVRSTGEF